MRQVLVWKPFAAAVAIIAVTIGVSIAPPSAAVSTPPDPISEVRATVDQVLAILQDPALKANAQERRQKLKEAVEHHFDFGSMARSALGYHWRDLADDERKQFVDLFTRFIEASYIGKIESYTGQKIEYVKQISEGSDFAQVNTNVLQNGKDPISVNYRLKFEDGEWKVYDVLIDNISIVGNYRNQFNRVINNKGYDVLVADMQAKQESLDKSIAQ
jgi:phospholipid transport system substrate-binding protein